MWVCDWVWDLDLDLDLKFLWIASTDRAAGVTIPNIFLWASLDSIFLASYSAFTLLSISEISPRTWSWISLLYRPNMNWSLRSSSESLWYLHSGKDNLSCDMYVSHVWAEVCFIFQNLNLESVWLDSGLKTFSKASNTSSGLLVVISNEEAMIWVACLPNQLINRPALACLLDHIAVLRIRCGSLLWIDLIPSICL